MQIPAEHETKSLTIQGVSFEVPVVVSEDDICEALTPVCAPSIAAQILQQTFMENWRNNFASEVTKAIKVAAEELEIDFSGKVSELSDEDAQSISEIINVEPLQASLNAYIRNYVPGIKRTGVSESLSPVEREMRKLAIELVKDHLEKKGIGRTSRSESYKLWDASVQEQLGKTGAAYIEELATELMETRPAIRETAERNVAGRQNLADSIELSFESASAA